MLREALGGAVQHLGQAKHGGLSSLTRCPPQSMQALHICCIATAVCAGHTLAHSLKKPTQSGKMCCQHPPCLANPELDGSKGQRTQLLARQAWVRP